MAAKKTKKIASSAKKATTKGAKPRASSSNKASSNRANGFIDLPAAEIGERVKRARGHLAAARAELAGLVRYSKKERQGSLGRFRDGEEDAILAVLDAIDGSPDVFKSLAAKDNGEDDALVETQPSRDDLARREALRPVMKDLAALSEDVGDTFLAIGARPRRFSIAAYAIGDVNAEHDAALASAMAPAKRFYAQHSRPKRVEEAAEGDEE